MIWYNQGIHIQLDGVHLLLDPSFTDLQERSPEDYLAIRKEQPPNSDYYNIDAIILSHAHTDHCDRLIFFEGMSMPFICHPMTADLKYTIVAQFPNKFLIRNGQSIDIRGLKITAYNSGHCGGSLMFLIEGSTKILFTGDINTQVTISTYPPSPIPCDILLIEASFGDPKYVFPNRNEVYQEIHNFLNKSFEQSDAVLLFGQALGKIQDIVMLIRSFAENDIMIALDGYSYNETVAFEKYYGEIDEKIDHYGKKCAYMRRDDIFQPEPQKKTLFLSHMFECTVEKIEGICERYGLYNPPIGVLSGWSNELITPVAEQYPDLVTFKLSSHADYLGLLNFIRECNPKCVGSFHGYAKSFIENGKKENLRMNLYNLHADRMPLLSDKS